MITSAGIERSAESILEILVAFDTTSRNSNLPLIDYAEAYLRPFCTEIRRLPNAEGTKANLLAAIGPSVPGGVVLSGHTDVVPIDGQEWTVPPFAVTRQGGRLYGRGVSDMKGFIAVALAAAPLFAEAALQRPIYFALSYDEEVGCLGAPALVDMIAGLEMRPGLVVVGEPSDMKIIGAHKGLSCYEVVVSGAEAHSSLPHRGISANMAAIGLLNRLVTIAADLERGPFDRAFDPPWSSLTVGTLAGGTAVNILARECRFTFDLRPLPGVDPEEVLASFFTDVETCDAELRARSSKAGVKVTRRANTPALQHEVRGEAERIVRSIIGDNYPSGQVSYGAEAGQFQAAGLSTVICGPGASFVSVTQAFNTTTSMGRLTLNVLLSFAQFEREVMGERVRDKIAASKRKGIWMGGPVPLGYDVASAWHS
jgi:acetylornithine deacetylase